MALNINQFAQTPVQGEIDMTVQGVQIVSGLVSSSESVALIPGQAVKVLDTASGVPTVTAVTSNTDVVFGFVTRNFKDANYPADSRLEIALNGTFMFMTANGAISRLGAVELDYAANKVGPAAGINPTVGYAYDKAAANNDLIRVFIETPKAGAQAGVTRTAVVVATLAEINAGKVLIPAVAGKRIRVTDLTARVTGAFATGTSVDVQSGTTAVKVSVMAEAGLTNGAVLKPGDANATRGTGYAANLPAGEALSVANVGSAQTGGTSIQYTITYAVV